VHQAEVVLLCNHALSTGPCEGEGDGERTVLFRSDPDQISSPTGITIGQVAVAATRLKNFHARRTFSTETKRKESVNSNFMEKSQVVSTCVKERPHFTVRFTVKLLSSVSQRRHFAEAAGA